MAKTILFQGDSITDAGRVRDDDRGTGVGYVTQAIGEIGLKYPGEYNYLNRGISGNRVTDVYARIKSDIINLKPDYMSILIGVNDVWHEYDFAKNNGVSSEKYEKIYSMLIEEVLEALPNIKIMILEPFVLEGRATTSTEEEPERWITFRSEVEKRAAAAKRVAEKYNLKFVPLQEKFDEASKGLPTELFVWDGVHPTHPGHAIIKNEWVKAFEEIK